MTGRERSVRRKQTKRQVAEAPAKRVLVVDDEPSVRGMLSDFLELNNFICLQAENGEAAVSYTQREKFDLVIMDIRMPGVSGMEALRTIKQKEPNQAVVMVTAVNEVDTAVEAMRLGADDYVMKPFVLRDMLGVVDHAIQTHANMQRVVEPDVVVEESPMTIAVGKPLDGTSERQWNEIQDIVTQLDSIQAQVADISVRVEALMQPRLKILAQPKRPDSVA